jgi:hypothetical protein
MFVLISLPQSDNRKLPPSTGMKKLPSAADRPWPPVRPSRAARDLLRKAAIAGNALAAGDNRFNSSGTGYEGQCLSYILRLT